MGRWVAVGCVIVVLSAVSFWVNVASTDAATHQRPLLRDDAAGLPDEQLPMTLGSAVVSQMRQQPPEGGWRSAETPRRVAYLLGIADYALITTGFLRFQMLRSQGATDATLQEVAEAYKACGATRTAEVVARAGVMADSELGRTALDQYIGLMRDGLKPGLKPPTDPFLALDEQFQAAYRAEGLPASAGTWLRKNLAAILPQQDS